jgi:hypothetical protein
MQGNIVEVFEVFITIDRFTLSLYFETKAVAQKFQAAMGRTGIVNTKRCILTPSKIIYFFEDNTQPIFFHTSEDVYTNLIEQKVSEERRYNFYKSEKDNKSMTASYNKLFSIYDRLSGFYGAVGKQINVFPAFRVDKTECGYNGDLTVSFWFKTIEDATEFIPKEPEDVLYNIIPVDLGSFGDPDRLVVIKNKSELCSFGCDPQNQLREVVECANDILEAVNKIRKVLTN